MSSRNDNASYLKPSEQPDQAYPMQPTMNPFFTPQVPHSTPFMPQYYPTPPFMPFQNMMTPSFNSMIYSVPDQSAINPWKSGRPCTQNPGCVSVPKNMVSFSQSSSSMTPFHNFHNIENIPPPSANATAPNLERAHPTTKSTLTHQNLPTFSKSTCNTSVFECMPSSSKDYGNAAVTACPKPNTLSQAKTPNKENNPLKRAADVDTDKLTKGAKWFKGEFEVKAKEAESSASMSAEIMEIPAPPPFVPAMRLLLGSVEQVLKWSSEKKSVQSSKILIKCIGIFVKELKSDQYHHLLLVKGLEPNSPSLQAAFYTIDRSLPQLKENQTALFTGHMKGSRRIQVYDIEVVSRNTLSDLQRIMQFSERAFQDLPQTF